MSETHQIHWWVWTLLMAVAVSASEHIGVVLLLTLLVLIAVERVAVRQRYSFTMLLGLIGFLLLVRITFQMFFGVPVGNQVLFTLPEIELFSLGLRLGGIFTLESLQTAVSEALTLGGIIIALLASSMMIPVSSLLRRLPSGFSNISLVLSIALSFLPQFIRDVKRNMRANRWRGHSQRKLSVLSLNLMIVVENALEKSIRLSASMWRRGLGSDRQSTSFDSLRTFGIFLFLASIGLSLLFTFHVALIYLMFVGILLIVFSYREALSNVELRIMKDMSMFALIGIALLVTGIWVTHSVNVEIILIAAIGFISFTFLQRPEVKAPYVEYSRA